MCTGSAPMGNRPGIDGGKPAQTVTTPAGETGTVQAQKPRSLLRISSAQEAQSPLKVDSAALGV